jgi:hypothetical protein
MWPTTSSEADGEEDVVVHDNAQAQGHLCA